MRFARLHWMIVLGMALSAPCGIASRAEGGFIPGDAATFVGEFRAFLTDFPRWDAAHLEMPLIALAMTPDQQRPAMLLLLWNLWMHDHPSASPGTTTVLLLSSLPATPPPVTGGPGTGTGGGTVAGGPPGGGGGGGGPPKSAPEPSSLALLACGGLSLFALRVVRFRAVRSHRTAGGDRG